MKSRKQYNQNKNATNDTKQQNIFFRSIHIILDRNSTELYSQTGVSITIPPRWYCTLCAGVIYASNRIITWLVSINQSNFYFAFCFYLFCFFCLLFFHWKSLYSLFFVLFGLNLNFISVNQWYLFFLSRSITIILEWFAFVECCCDFFFIFYLLDSFIEIVNRFNLNVFFAVSDGNQIEE